MATHSSVFAWGIPGTGGAWWAAVYGVAQSQTPLKRLSSSIVQEQDREVSSHRFYSTLFKVPARAISEERKLKESQIGKEVKLSLFADYDTTPRES